MVLPGKIWDGMWCGLVGWHVYGMVRYMDWSSRHGMIYGVVWRAWHGWYMVWHGGHRMVYDWSGEVWHGIYYCLVGYGMVQ